MSAVPSYGEVRWRDAYGAKSRIRAGKMTKTLPVVASVGKLFMDADGTLVIVHEYDPQHGVYQKSVEMTVIPQAWIQEIIPLTAPTVTPKKVEGTDVTVHQTE
mgnify:FL=1